MMMVISTNAAGKVSEVQHTLARQYLSQAAKRIELEESYRLTGFVQAIGENAVRFDYLGDFRTEVQVTVTYVYDLYNVKAELVGTKGKTKGQRTTIYEAEGVYGECFADLHRYIGRRAAVAAEVQ